MCAKERTLQRQSVRGKSLPCVKGDSPQCGEMSRSDRGARRVRGCPAGAEGLWPCGGSSMYGQGHNPPPPSAEPPLHKGAFNSTPIEFILAPEGSSGEETKSVKKRAALLHVLAFCFFDFLFGVLRGEQPLSRASRAIGSSGHLFRFLFGCPKRKDSRKNDASPSAPPQGGGKRKREQNQKIKSPRWRRRGCRTIDRSAK